MVMKISNTITSIIIMGNVSMGDPRHLISENQETRLDPEMFCHCFCLFKSMVSSDQCLELNDDTMNRLIT